MCMTQNSVREQSDSNTLACSYAALILHDEGLPINVENLNKIIKASSVEVESFWPGMFAKALSAAKVDELLASVGTGEKFNNLLLIFSKHGGYFILFYLLHVMQST